jgi:hypothetical protein
MKDMEMTETAASKTAVSMQREVVRIEREIAHRDLNENENE